MLAVISNAMSINLCLLFRVDSLKACTRYIYYAIVHEVHKKENKVIDKQSHRIASMASRL